MTKEPDGYIINGSTVNGFHRYAIGDEVRLSCNSHNFEKFESSYITATCKLNNVLGEYNLPVHVSMTVPITPTFSIVRCKRFG